MLFVGRYAISLSQYGHDYANVFVVMVSCARLLIVFVAVCAEFYVQVACSSTA